MKLSESIKQFLDVWDNCNRIYSINQEIVEQHNKASQDFLHAIELDNLTYKERAKLTTTEKINRIERRKAKNIIETYEPLMRYAEIEENKKAINLLKKVLGEVRKVEKYHENRTYHKKI